MNPTAVQKRLMERILNVFETGKPDGEYGAIAIFADGPHDIRQITYGRSQTTEYGNLAELIRDYVAAGGIFSAALTLFAENVGRIPLTDDAAFKQLLRRAGREDPTMQRVQDLFFDRRYFQPAMQWAVDQGFQLALSGLVIYDSFIHSGSILPVIRALFPEVPPSKGGDEKAWTRAYCKARRKWLAGHRREIVRRTVYRPDDLLREINRDNWDLSRVPIRANGVSVTS
jgi:chitosanase